MIFGVKKTKLQETLVVYIYTIEYCISANNTFRSCEFRGGEFFNKIQNKTPDLARGRECII